MASSSNRLVPPSKKTVKFLLGGLALFFPETIYGKRGKKYPTVDYWVGTGYRRTEFTRLLFNITGKENETEAANQVKKWKLAWDEGETPSATVPEKLNDILSDLGESPAETKLSAYNQQRLAKEALLLSQVAVEKSSRTPPPTTMEVPSQAPMEVSDPLTTFAGNILTAPFKAAVYISGPTVHSKNPGLATARYLLTHNIFLPSKAQGLGISSEQLKNLERLIKLEQETHPFAYKWISIISSGRKARLAQSQILALLEPSVDGSIAVLPRKSFLGGFFGRIGQQLFGKLAATGLKTIGKKIGTGVATKAVAAAIGLGTGNILFVVGQAILGKVKDIISSLKTKKETILALLLGSMVVGGLFIGGAFGAILIAGSIVPGLGYLYAKAGGAGALGASVGNYTGAFLTGVTGVIIPAVSIPAIAAFISIPLLITFILFIINSGAYVVPPQDTLLLSENQYLSVEKTAEPSGPFENNDLPLTITYTITVTAKKGTLTNISFDHNCEIIRKSGTSNCEVPLPDKAPSIISPVDPYVFTYTSTLSGANYQDSLVLNTFSVTADADEAEQTTAIGSAAIIIGNPPTECFVFESGESDPEGRKSISWEKDPAGKANILGAIGILARSPSYMTPLCARGPIHLYRIPVKFGGGWASSSNGGTIFLYNGGVGSYGSAVYTLAHETGHITNWRRFDVFEDFRQQGISAREGFLHTYPNEKDIWEDFAETIGLYVGESFYHPTKWGVFKYAEKYPLHYNFAKTLFGGVIY